MGWKMKNLLRAMLVSAVSVSTGFMVSEVHAVGITPGETIIAVFDSVVTQGYIANEPALGQNTFHDNSGTAVFSTTNSTNTTTTGSPAFQTNGSKLQWGSTPNFSSLIFFGAEIPVVFDEPFLIGRLTYHNGTSNLGTLIFGANISFYNEFVDPSRHLATDQVIITTTNNIGTSLAQNADYINICGSRSNLCDDSLQGFETDAGGTGVTFDLYGQIIGDPMLFLTAVEVTPGQGPLSGLVGHEPPIGTEVQAVPEPTSIGILAAALGMLGFIRRRSAKCCIR
jgi:hypothetical protein